MVHVRGDNAKIMCNQCNRWLDAATKRSSGCLLDELLNVVRRCRSRRGRSRCKRTMMDEAAWRRRGRSIK